MNTAEHCVQNIERLTEAINRLDAEWAQVQPLCPVGGRIHVLVRRERAHLDDDRERYRITARSLRGAP